MFKLYRRLSIRVLNRLKRAIPGFDLLMNKVRADMPENELLSKERREARKKAMAEAAMQNSNTGFQPRL